jgi:hypothetical protein
LVNGGDRGNGEGIITEERSDRECQEFCVWGG